MAVTILKLNFRGVYFEVDVNVLQRAPESRLANIARGKERVPMDNDGRHFIDRNPLYFHHILNYYNSGRLEFPPQYSWESIKNEIEFWQIDLNPLTKNSVLRYEKQKVALEEAEFINNYYSRYDLNAKGTICRGCSDAFRGMYEFFDVPRSSIPSMIYSIFMCILIPLFSVSFTIIRTIPQFKHYRLVNSSGVETYKFAEDDTEVLSDVYWLCEISVIGIFFLETFLRFLCWPAKCQFFLDALNWADAAGIVFPLLRCLVVILPLNLHANLALLTAFISFRLFRIFRIWRCFNAYRSLLLAIKYSVKDLFLSLGVTFVLVVVYAMLFDASSHDNRGYHTVPETLWLSVITLTSVGYGDIYPVNFIQKVIGVFCLLTTILVVILPAVSLVNNYARALGNLKLAAVLRKAQLIPLAKECPVDLNQPGTQMYPVLPADSDQIPIVHSTA